MALISDIIEKFIKDLMKECNTVQIHRNELASLFDCAPSQINMFSQLVFLGKKDMMSKVKREAVDMLKLTRLKLPIKNMSYILYIKISTKK